MPSISEVAGTNLIPPAAGVYVPALDTNGTDEPAVIDVGDLAPLDSPALTGTPTAPTAAWDEDSTVIATTGHVHAVVTERAAPTNAQYLVVASDGTLTNESVLTAGSGITLTPGAGTLEIAADGGGGSDYSLLLHLDPANATVDGSNNVDSYADDGVRGVVLRQALTLRPTRVAAPTGWNSQSVIRYDGSNDYLRASLNAGSLMAWTLAVVLAPRNTSTVGLLAWDNTLGTNASPYLFFQRNSTDVKVYADGNFRWTIAHTTDTPKLYILTFDSNQYQLYVDGTAQTAYVIAAPGAPANLANGTQLMFGVGYNAYGNVDIGEFYLYNRVLSSSDRTALTSTLKTKYGIA